MKFCRQEYWSGLSFPSPGGLPDPGIKPVSPALVGGFFTTEPPAKFSLKSLPRSLLYVLEFGIHVGLGLHTSPTTSWLCVCSWQVALLLGRRFSQLKMELRLLPAT